MKARYGDLGAGGFPTLLIDLANCSGWVIQSQTSAAAGEHFLVFRMVIKTWTYIFHLQYFTLKALFCCHVS